MQPAYISCGTAFTKKMETCFLLLLAERTSVIEIICHTNICLISFSRVCLSVRLSLYGHFAYNKLIDSFIDQFIITASLSYECDTSDRRRPKTL